MGVSDKDLFNFQSQIVDAAVNAADFIAGIDDDGLAGGLVAEKGAIALQRADGKGLKDHEAILVRVDVCR